MACFASGFLEKVPEVGELRNAHAKQYDEHPGPLHGVNPLSQNERRKQESSWELGGRHDGRKAGWKMGRSQPEQKDGQQQPEAPEDNAERNYSLQEHA